MKIRIKGNSIRLRLTQAEVSKFRDHGVIRENTSFSDSQNFSYELLHSSEVSSISAAFQKDTITLFVPSKEAIQWSESEMVGLEQQIQTDQAEPLKILIEKDFQCLKPRPGEDESDHYPNPLAKEM